MSAPILSITIEPTPVLIRLPDRPARIWIGRTSTGVVVQLLVSGVAVEENENTREIERQLVEQPAIAFHGIPFRAGLDAHNQWRALCKRCGLSEETATPQAIADYVAGLQERIGQEASTILIELDQVERVKACRFCGGTGSHDHAPCPVCGGRR